MKPTTFIFDSYSFKPERRLIEFSYKYTFEPNKKPIRLKETIILPRRPNTKNLPKSIIKNTLELLHLIIGISYYKLYCPRNIKLTYHISKSQADFFKIIYTEGLGEFWYSNKLSPNNKIIFPYNEEHETRSTPIKRKNRSLLGIGGGKDSILAHELLKEHNKSHTGFVVQTGEVSDIIKNVCGVMKLPAIKIQRFIDPLLLDPPTDSYKGHVPISAIWACLSILTAVLYDYDAFITGNEQSSNVGNVKWSGIEVNHQWSKSQRCETLLQNYIRDHITPSIRIFSLLRPFSELRITKSFSKYEKYFSVFSSCNKNFRHINELNSIWCGACPKCHFVFLMIAPFISKKNLLSIFKKNYFDDPTLLTAYKNLLGVGKMKPFECVGTFEESRVALWMLRNKYKNSYIVKALIPEIQDGEKLFDDVMKIHETPNLPDEYRLYGLKNCSIIGFGQEGKTTHEYLRQYHPNLKVKILDQQTDKNYLDHQSKYEFSIKTPGIPQSKLTLPHTTATNIFFSSIKNQIIGITGTKGKSTTSSLIYHILRHAKFSVAFVGNIGKPMLGQLLRKTPSKSTIFVAELSSYQLDDIRYSPHIAVALNIFNEHMDYHRTKDAYTKAKHNITKYQNHSDHLVYNGLDSTLAKWTKTTRAKTHDFTRIETVYESQLLGAHNANNTKAAICVARLLKVSEKIIKEAVASFKPLKHRLQYVGTFKEILFYNDAISTTPESAIAAIKTLQNIGTIFLGGYDRGYDFTELEHTLKKYKIKNIVLFPESGNRILCEPEKFNVLKTRSMSEAVRFGYAHTPKGMICLLSTASPSYGIWKNFEHKGSDFINKIKIIGME